MSTKLLYSPAEEKQFLAYTQSKNWSEATTLVFSKTQHICSSVFRRAGRVLEGGFVEETDLANDMWINIYTYLSSSNNYQYANNPLGFTIKHVQRYFLNLNSNEKGTSLFQDTRYSGSQRIPYRRSIGGSLYHEVQASSLERIQNSSDNNDVDYNDTENEEEANLENEETVSTEETCLTKSKIFNMVYSRIADIADAIDIAELNLSNEPAIFLTKEEGEYEYTN